MPFVDSWETVFDGSIDAQVATLVVENAGDVDVHYNLPAMGDAPTGRIVLEAARFTAAGDTTEAQMRFDGISVRVEDEAGAPCDPSSPGGLTDGCAIEVQVDAPRLPDWSGDPDGAHLRLFLPVDFRGRLRLEVRDALWPDCSYLARSDVRVKDLFGSASIRLASGTAQVELADGILPAPFCDPEAATNQAKNDACAGYTDPDTGMPTPWDKDCGCIDALGVVDVETSQPNAANITVDAPSDLWTTINAGNEEPGQTADGDFASCELDKARCADAEPWNCVAATNVPSGALEGTGYALGLTSAHCSDVELHLSPGDYPGSPATERRGFIEVCSGCLDLPAVAPPN